jgi:hypothetical protein
MPQPSAELLLHLAERSCYARAHKRLRDSQEGMDRQRHYGKCRYLTLLKHIAAAEPLESILFESEKHFVILESSLSLHGPAGQLIEVT